MKFFGRKFILGLMVLASICCTKKTEDSRELNLEDTVNVVQSVLADKPLEAELIKDFGNQQLKLITGIAVKHNQQFTFAGKPAQVVSVAGDVYQIHEQHPKEFYVSIPSIKFFTNDSATIFFIFHAGNATARFNLKNENGNWVIKNRQYGKF
ncbi:hypothetical protein IC229_11230 [Spirosoma sp. BT702]|uniref:Uncharacterized protein n=1 Tax=Spirosoma profusum TaxID=2771354 RepID=A0A926Y2X1_9BACT|nr:hypothetical protein [Spirosoma profusum]MBD2701211.1 hypothetical protein [Spirosoma profusum]